MIEVIINVSALCGYDHAICERWAESECFMDAVSEGFPFDGDGGAFMVSWRLTNEQAGRARYAALHAGLSPKSANLPIQQIVEAVVWRELDLIRKLGESQQ